MLIYLMTNESEAINEIVDEDGYRFTAKGDITESKLRAWVNIVGERLKKEEVLSTSNGIEKIIIIPGNKRIYKKNIRKAEKSNLLQISDFCENIKTAVIYVVLDKDRIGDRYNMEIMIPLLLDCETIDSLFDDDGNYVGSQKKTDDYMKI